MRGSDGELKRRGYLIPFCSTEKPKEIFFKFTAHRFVKPLLFPCLLGY